MYDPLSNKKNLFRKHKQTTFTWIGAISENFRLVLVLHEVVNVGHLVVGGDQVFHIDIGAHLNPTTTLLSGGLGERRV
jgi:hypothetical protein